MNTEIAIWEQYETSVMKNKQISNYVNILHVWS